MFESQSESGDQAEMPNPIDYILEAVEKDKQRRCEAARLVYVNDLDHYNAWESYHNLTLQHLNSGDWRGIPNLQPPTVPYVSWTTLANDLDVYRNIGCLMDAVPSLPPFDGWAS